MNEKLTNSTLVDNMKIRRTANSTLFRMRRYWKGYVFLVPIFLVMGTFKFIPLFTALAMSFFEWNGANVMRFIGVSNFTELLQNLQFHTALKNMFIYTASNLVIQLTVPLLVAVMVFHVKWKRLQDLLKVAFIIPLVVPSIVIFLMWQWIYAGDYGVLNELLKSIGLESWTKAWLGESSTAIWSVIFVNFPWIGGISFLIYLAGMMSIPSEMFELSKLEGMTAFQRFRHIEFPLIRSQIKLIVMMTILTQIQSFENVLMLTNGGPGISTLTPALFMYNEGFGYNRMGFASAAGFMLFVLIMFVVWLNQKFIKNTDKID